MTTVTGGCLCSAVRYAHDGPVGPANCCHCADCRRCTGGPFGISIRVEAARFRIVSGNPRGFTKAGDSGQPLTRHFCADCGSPIYTSAPRHPEHVYLKAGSLDDPAPVRVERQAWVQSMVACAERRRDRRAGARPDRVQRRQAIRHPQGDGSRARACL